MPLLAGKLRFVLLLLLRVPVLLFAAFPLYVDDQERFACNTLQPGCAAVCYDTFSPMSPLRLWLVHLAAVCLPCAAFGVYVVHKATPVPAALSGAERSPPSDGSTSRVQRGEADTYAAAYFLHLVPRVLLEAGFGAGQYYLFGMDVPRRFLCHEIPCTTTVDCYTSGPTEKTVMLRLTLGLSAFSVLFDLADLACAARRWADRVRGRRRTLVEKIYEEERYDLSAGGQGADTGVPVALDLGATTTAAAHGRTSSTGETGEADPLPAPFVPPQAREDAPEREGSEVALCPASLPGSPRQLWVCKRGRLRPPPPPRRDSSATAVCTTRAGQYTLVEKTAPDLQANSADVQDKRSEWV
ncbi:gap junction delta-4 protein-like [Scleropages formosus]|uniref:Gap junction delta-4 protein-like n=1 Tax=Scleropages formosus TaxID=113540 RepID=A0A0P7VKN6_SCLFO|nr:gap junction delta-4 protein-like [Scleropages formosus]